MNKGVAQGGNRQTVALALVILIGLLLAWLIPTQLSPSVLSSPELMYVELVVLLVVAVGPVITRYRRKELEICDPAVFLVVGYLLHFGIGGITPTIVGSTFLSANPGDPDFAYLNVAGFLAILGIAAFHLAYFSPTGRRLAARFKLPPAVWEPKRALAIAVWCTIIGLLLQLALEISAERGLAGSTYESIDDYRRNAEGITYISAFSNLSALGLLAFVILARTYKMRSATWLFFVFFIPQVGLQFISGSRSALGFFLLGTVVAFYLTTDRGAFQRRKYARITSVAMGFFLFLFPLISAFRYQGAAGAADISTAAPQLFTVDAISSEIGERFHGMSSLAIVVKRIPSEVPYSYGSQVGLTLISWIPRAVWPDKPTISLGKQFAQEVVPPGVFPPGTSAAVTLPGEFYWNFGFVGLLAGMAFLGYGLRIIRELLVVPKGNSSAVLILTFIVPTLLIGIEQDLGAILTYGTVNYVMALVVCRMMARGAKA